MLNLQLDEVAKHLNCPATPPLLIEAISIDSRKIQQNSLFIALRGEQFDGHDFIPAAIANGAVAVIVESINPEIKTVPQLLVKNTLSALADIASMHRQTINCPVIALTGSNGKTTVKEMIASILPKPSHATPGNLNNHIGAPLSILQLKPEHRYAVFELGANHPGEIAYTAAIVQPQISLINNIAPAHIEGFGSIEVVANAKGEIYEHLVAGGTAIVNDDDAFAHHWDPLLEGKRVIRFSLHKVSDFNAKQITFDDSGSAGFTLVCPLGEMAVQLQVPGEHSIRNALAAAACCYAAGIDLTTIVQGLCAFNGVAGRMAFLPGKSASLIIDDSYNANLQSVLTAVNVLAKRQGQRILVLGDMGELGAWTQQHHEEIGHKALHLGIDKLLTCGKHSHFSSQAFGDKACHFHNQEALVENLLPTLNKNTTVLVKGSRSAAMEKIVHQLVREKD